MLVLFNLKIFSCSQEYSQYFNQILCDFISYLKSYETIVMKDFLFFSFMLLFLFHLKL